MYKLSSFIGYITRTSLEHVYGRFLRGLICTIAILALDAPLWAVEFSGKWAVYKVDTPGNYFGEIKYPRYFELSETDGKLTGSYIDQYDGSCQFPLAITVNGGNELLLMNCGVTKHADSWAPLHKVKKIDGELVGSVVTYDQQFVWHAKPADGPP